MKGVQMGLLIAASIGVGFGALMYFVLPEPASTHTLDRALLRRLAEESDQGDVAAGDVAVAKSNSPLRGVVVLVTGATAGLGKEIASELYLLGASVMVASRTHSKVLATIQEIQAEHASAGSVVGLLEAGVIDTSDLRSVKTFAEQFLSTHTHLHVLVNNAGIHYFSSPGTYTKDNSVSPQGYDLAWATNYLGHFALTKHLLPLMQQTASTKKSSTSIAGRIINVSSTYHLQSDGKMLLPTRQAGSTGSSFSSPPAAARGDVHTFQHQRRSYSNNKLAQILHAKELMRRHEGIEAFAVCPGWTTTDMTARDKDKFTSKFMARQAFTGKAGILSAMGAILDTKKFKGGEFVVNFHNFYTAQSWSNGLFKTITNWGIRDGICDLLAISILLFQGASYGYLIENSSPESNDEKLASELYEWSESVVAPF